MVALVFHKCLDLRKMSILGQAPNHTLLVCLAFILNSEYIFVRKFTL